MPLLMQRSANECCASQKSDSDLTDESDLMSLPVIAITNASTCLTDSQVAAAIPALQRQVTLDFRGYWDVDCQLTSLPSHLPLVEGWWQILVTDDPDQAGALGYHELTSHGSPLGKVFAGLDLLSGGSWTVTLSHELLEMLADPWINWCAQASDGKVYALEVCDPVEADKMGYEIDGVLVSDFITPSWFQPNLESTMAEQLDFKGRIKKPLELAAGGYISILGSDGRWKQVAAQGEPTSSVPMGSRRQRRNLGKAKWRKSTSCASARRL